MNNKQIKGLVVWVSEDSMSVAINKGTLDGVVKGMRFLVYKIGEELFDPVTHKSLGNLEIVCGEGVATHVQEQISTIHSIEIEIKHKRMIKHQPASPFWSLPLKMAPQEIDEPVEIKKPFSEVVTGCYVRAI